MLSDTIFRRSHAPGVLSDVAADKAVLIAGRIGGKHQAMLLNRLLQFKGRNSWLANRIKVIRVDLNDLVHPIGANHDTAVDRNRPTGVTDAAAAGRNRK